MRVTLTKRLGQNKPGTVIDTTVTQARWMFERRVAVAADEPEHSEHDGTPSAQADDGTTSGETPKRGRRSSKTLGDTTASSE